MPRVLDVLIYAEPVAKVFSQGAFAAIVQQPDGCRRRRRCSLLAYSKTIAKKGSLDKE